MSRSRFWCGVGVAVLSLLFMVPHEASAIGFEIAAGMWSQTPEGTFSYEQAPLTATDLDVVDILGLEKEAKFGGRLKLDIPFIPSIYLMATPMSFEGKQSLGQDITFGDFTFPTGNVLSSKLTMDHYDIALYYGLPFLKLATLGKFNVDIGLNAKILTFQAELNGVNTATNATISEKTDKITIPVPMAYLSAQLKPIDLIGIEAEVRYIGYDGNSFLDAIGRLKINPPIPFVFAAVGYRYEGIKVDTDDIKADVTFKGPFVEVGAGW